VFGFVIELGLGEVMTHEESFRLKTVPREVDAGWELSEMRPDCVVADLSIGRTEALSVVHFARKHKELEDIALIVLLVHEGDGKSFKCGEANEAHEKPKTSAEFLRDRVCTLVEQKKEPPDS
jgi:hypothetical protein